MKTSLFSMAAVAGMAFCSAVPAAATIEIFEGAGSVMPAENVLFQGGVPPSGFNAFAITNNTATQVTFTGLEALNTEESMGQARIEAADGTVNALSFALTDPTLGFTEVEFSIFGSGGTATSVDLVFTDNFATEFTRTATIGGGNNFFAARAIDGQIITSVSFLLNGSVSDVRQVRIGGFELIDDGNPSAIPEPASWALLMTGFALVGYGMRRRQRMATVTA